MQRKILAVRKLLRRRFGRLKFRTEKDPIGELVKTILSQNTSDINSLRAYDNLKRCFSSWDKVMNADTAAIKHEIKSGGLANIKAARIKSVLREIADRRGRLDLSFLGRLDISSAYNFLRTIKGVGPKTAAIVLLFCFGKPIMPVDTHILRVGQRLGLIPKGISREKTQEYLTSVTPPNAIKEFHVYLILHGRQLCTARNPKCPICNLKKMCKYYKEKVSSPLKR